MANDLRRQIDESCEAIRAQWQRTAKVGIILGTGLGGLAQDLDTEAVLGYQAIPHFPRSTALGHAGQLACGHLSGLPTLMMEGRLHAYEGYSAAQATFPVRVMRELGIELLIVSNACGGMNPRYRTGDVMILEDHINLMNANPLIGIDHEAVGPRYPDMSAPYDRTLIERAEGIARREDIVVHRGTYVAVTGPNYETRAEYRFLRKIGGDVVGMSTVPEVIVAAHVGLRVLALSTVTNVCLPDRLEKTKGEQVVAAAEQAEGKMRKLVLGIMQFEAARVKTGLKG